MNDLQRLLKNQKGHNGVSLFEHLCELIKKLQDEKKLNSKLSDYENIEVLSNLIKKNYFIYKDPAQSSEVNELVEKRQKHSSEMTIRASQLEQLINNLLNKKRMKDVQGQVQNWMQMSRMFEWAGIGFGEVNDYKIQAALKQLAIENDTYEIQFWGKILCQNFDYWVISGRLKKYYDEEPDLKFQEKNGTGINSITFWVSHDLGITQKWVELPTINSQQLKVSRQLKRILKGDLEGVVDGYPIFMGKEKHFLKCQLVRISHSSIIVPSGLYKLTEEQEGVAFKRGEVEFTEEFKVPEITELSALEGWVHRWPQILKAGLVYHQVDASLPEEQRQAQLEENQANDPEQDALRAINEDANIDENTPNWSCKQIGEHQIFNKEDGTTINYAPILLKNYKWPGTFTVAANGKFSSIYIGYGYKGDSQPLFFPQEPKDIMDDPEEQEEKPEPNPKNPINEVEPDSDDEKKNEDDNE